jgi:hypothetical protein
MASAAFTSCGAKRTNVTTQKYRLARIANSHIFEFIKKQTFNGTVRYERLLSELSKMSCAFFYTLFLSLICIAQLWIGLYCNATGTPGCAYGPFNWRFVETLDATGFASNRSTDVFYTPPIPNAFLPGGTGPCAIIATKNNSYALWASDNYAYFSGA